MDRKEAEKYRKLLMEMLQDAYDQLKESSEELTASVADSSGENTSSPFHLADIGTDSMEREKAFMIAAMDSDEYYDIIDALEKIEKDEYGTCEQCEEEIDSKRLDAIPYARLCIDCKSKEEKR